MKNLALLISLTVFTQIGHAQVRVEYIPEQFKLRGRIKQIIEYNYINPRNIDSLKNPVRIIKDFDEKGYQLDEITYNKLENLESKTVFDNSNANTVIQSCNDSKGDLKWKTVSKYDNNGNEKEVSNYLDATAGTPPEVNSFKFIYNYDDINNMVEMDTYSSNSILSAKEVYIYNENHQITEEHRTDYLPGRVSEKKVFFHYDLNGNKITSRRYDSNARLKVEHIITYSNFDNEGNWLTETYDTIIHYTGSQDYHTKDISKREILYFK